MTDARILIVEDEALISRDLSFNLTRLGYTIVGVTGIGEDAVALAEEHRPDLVIMDIMLQGSMTGIEAARSIRANVGSAVIFLSAYSAPRDIERAKVAEPFGYLVKPFTIDALRSSMEMALYKSQQEDRERHAVKRMAQHVSSGGGIGEQLFVKDKGRNIRLSTKEIVYVEALKDYMAVHIKERRYIVHSTLQRLVAMFPANEFIQVHRSFVIRLDKVASIQGQLVALEGIAKRIPIGRAYQARFMQLIDPV